MKLIIALWTCILMLVRPGESAVCSEFRSVFSGGSEMQRCNVTLHSDPSKVSPRFQTFVLRWSRSEGFLGAQLSCSVISVGICSENQENQRKLVKEFGRRFRMKDDTALIMIRKRHQRILKSSELIVVLRCGERFCFAKNHPESTVTDMSSPEQTLQLSSLSRKLLSLKSNADVNRGGHVISQIPYLAVVAGIASFVGLVLVLALCGSCDNNVEEALSDEVGGSGDSNLRVVAVSHIKVEDSSVPGTPNPQTKEAGKDKLEEDSHAQKSSKSHENGSIGDRTQSNASAHSNRSNQDGKGGVIASSGSHSSASRLPRASGSTTSKNKEELVSAELPDKRSSRASLASATSREGTGDIGKISQSENRLSREGIGEIGKTSRSDSRHSEGSPTTDQIDGFDFERNVVDQPVEVGKRQSKSVISKLRHGSGHSKEKRKSSGEDEQKNKFWLRRKSSKIKKLEDVSPKHVVPDLSVRPRVATPPTHHREHQRDLPLPPPPQAVSARTAPGGRLSSATDGLTEDDQYEIVEKRRATSLKTSKYDEVIVSERRDRDTSEMYDCIDEKEIKRVSSASDQYDVVEFTRLKPTSVDDVDDDYAIVETRRNDGDRLTVNEDENRRTSTGSDLLYDIVIDNVKVHSGAATGDPSDTYAVVQKGPSRKSLSRAEGNDYAEPDTPHHRGVAAKGNDYAEPDTPHQRGVAIPQPPTLSSLITVADSGRRRASSEEIDSDRGSSPSSPERASYLRGSPTGRMGSSPERAPLNLLEAAQPREYTYAAVDKSRKTSGKTRHSSDYTDERAPSPDRMYPTADEFELPSGFYEGSDTPPPIPHSLYADLEKEQAEASRLAGKQLKQSTQDYEEIQGGKPLNDKKRSESSKISDYEEIVTVVTQTAQSNTITTRTTHAHAPNDSLDASGYYDEIVTPTPTPTKTPDGNHLYDLVDTSSTRDTSNKVFV